MARLSLRIKADAAPSAYRGDWTLDGQVIGNPIQVKGPAAVALADLAKSYLDLFGQDSRPVAPPDHLRAIGQSLFQTWFASVWPAITSNLTGSGPNDLIVRSTGRAVLNWPWELVELTPGLPVGCDVAWSLCRSPSEEEATGSAAPARPGPLRILFLSAAPSGAVPLDYEREEDAMLRATSRLRDVAVHFAETGSFAELIDLVGQCRPHVVHLSGHGTVTDDGRGAFVFEDERGRADVQDAEAIVARVFRGGHQGVRCAFFNGCKTSQAASAGLCQSLVVAGLPMALGWSASVADDRATEFTAEFYRRLVGGEPVPAASAHARLTIRDKGKYRQGQVDLQDATFALPQLYAPAADGLLFDQTLPPEPYAGPRTRYVLLGDGIKGLGDGFIGRRREIQRLVPALRDGSTTFAVLTGIGGAGKSTLATRAANRLAADGFAAVPIRAEADPRGPREAGRALVSRIISAVDDEFIRAKRDDLHGQVTDGRLPLEQRLRLVVKGLKELRLALVLDNFEDVLDLESRRIVDVDLSRFYRSLATDLTEGSRAIVTCRYLPEPTPLDEPTVLHLPLNDFNESDFEKFLRRDAKVEERITHGKLSKPLLHKLYDAFGGTPGFLKGIRELLKTADPDVLNDDLDGIAPGDLSAARDRYFQRIITARLYEALPPEARTLASRMALSELPLPAEAAATVVGADADSVMTSLDACLAFGLLQRFDDTDPPLFHPPGLLRPWLADPTHLDATDATAVHRQLAAYWRSSFEAGREVEFRVPFDVELAACRSHARLGDDLPTFRWATVLLARYLHRKAEWTAALSLLEEIEDADHDAASLLALAIVEDSLGEWQIARHHLERANELLPDDSSEKATTWHELATIDISEGHYAAAREKTARSLATLQAVGDRAGEAASLHGLATIDLSEGHYRAAREKTARSLAIRQATGDRAGEAASFMQLGALAFKLRPGDDAARLVAICFLIDRAIGHGETESDLRNLSVVCQQLGYDQARFDAMLDEVSRSYEQDQGRSLIELAFSMGGKPESDPPTAPSK